METAQHFMQEAVASALADMIVQADRLKVFRIILDCPTECLVALGGELARLGEKRMLVWMVYNARCESLALPARVVVVGGGS